MSKLLVAVAIGATLVASTAFAGQHSAKLKNTTSKAAYNMVSADSANGPTSKMQVYVAGQGLTWQTIQPENPNK